MGRTLLRRHLLVEWAQVGDELEEHWELINNARLPLLWLEIEDASTLPGYSGRRVAAAGIGDQQNWTTQAPASCAVSTQAAHRVAERSIWPISLRMARGQPRQIVIYPPLVQLPALIVPQGQRGGLSRADILPATCHPALAACANMFRATHPATSTGPPSLNR